MKIFFKISIFVFLYLRGLFDVDEQESEFRRLDTVAGWHSGARRGAIQVRPLCGREWIWGNCFYEGFTSGGDIEV